jgi:O-antigen/teichoic acid export membrane protein
MQAGFAIGVAGLGRIALNSVISLRFGSVEFGRYAATVAAIILVGSLAAAGPAAAATLGAARRWAQLPGVLPTGLVRFLAGMLGFFLVAAVATGLWSGPVRGPMSPAVWAVAVTVYVGYQVARAFGYAVQRAAAVTTAEVAGAIASLAAVAVLAFVGPTRPLQALVLIYISGPLVFLATFWQRVRGDVRVHRGALTPAERRAGLREGIVFFAGAGSSMAMQYLPVIIAGRMQATTTAAVLFGAVQATAPLLLLSRVYGAVMMPAFAGDADEGHAHAHMRLVQPFFLSSLAVALGLAPWVALSLGLPATGGVLSVAALVALMTLLQVWATPAVTILSARRREMVPALASLGGLVVAVLVWIWGAEIGSVLLLPVGLAIGAVVRSLVPMWVIAGRRMGRLDGPTLGTLGGAMSIAAVLVVVGRGTTPLALGGGALLLLGGLAWGYRTWTRIQTGDADSAR